MARRQITADTVQEIDGEFDDVSGIEDAAREVQKSIDEELGSSQSDVRFRMKVFRVPTNGRKFIWLFDRDGYDITGMAEFLRDNYGTGIYEAQVWKNGVLDRKHPFAVELPKAAPQPNHGGDALTTMVAKQGELLSALAAQLIEMKRAPVAVTPAPNPIDMFAQMAAMAESMRKMMGPPPQAVDPLATLTAVISLVKDANSEGREKGVIDLISDALNSDLLKGIIQNQQAQTQQVPPRAALPQPTQNTAPPPAVQSQQVPPQDPQLKAFSDFLDLLVRAARVNGDHMLYADLVEATIEPALLAQLLAMPDPVDALAQYKPEVSTYRDWFGAVLNALTEPPEQAQMPGALNATASKAHAAGSHPSAVSPAASADGAS